MRAWQAAATERRLAQRAEIVLRAADGHATGAIAAAMGTRPARVSKWRTRFARQLLRGLADAPRAGAPRQYGSTAEYRVLDPPYASLRQRFCPGRLIAMLRKPYVKPGNRTGFFYAVRNTGRNKDHISYADELLCSTLMNTIDNFSASYHCA